MEQLGWSSLHKILGDVTSGSILQFTFGGTPKEGRTSDGEKTGNFKNVIVKWKNQVEAER